MKINTKLLTALSISVLLANGTQAQEAWDLTRCIDYAIAHNLTVKQQEAARDKSEVELNTAKWSRLPDLTVGPLTLSTSDEACRPTIRTRVSTHRTPAST